MDTIETATKLADAINAAAIEDNYGCTIVAKPWTNGRFSRVYLNTERRQMGSIFVAADGRIGLSSTVQAIVDAQ
jgi:hypothetical protein